MDRSSVRGRGVSPPNNEEGRLAANETASNVTDGDAFSIRPQQDDPDDRPVITYADPTGEEAVWRVMRDRAQAAVRKVMRGRS